MASTFIAADDDQCNDYLEPVFGKRHRYTIFPKIKIHICTLNLLNINFSHLSCDMETTFCLQSIPNGSLTSRGAYTCVCNFGYYIPNRKLQGFDGQDVEKGNGNYTCIPCPNTCTTCDENGDCFLGETEDSWSVEMLMLVSIGAVLAACILCCVILAAIVFRQRKCRVCRAY